MGMVPNLLLVMANSPVVLEGYLVLNEALERGVLSERFRQQMALAVAEHHRSDYWVAGHVVLGRAAGLSDEEIMDARAGRSSSSKVQTALRFACRMLEKRGELDHDDWARLRGAGYSDREITEILGWIGVNTFRDYFAQATQTEIDFPKAIATW
jgi:AhpD family alkylhydroperoxidase